MLKFHQDIVWSFNYRHNVFYVQFWGENRELRNKNGAHVTVVNMWRTTSCSTIFVDWRSFVTNAVTWMLTMSNFFMTMLAPMLWLLSVRKATNLLGRCSNIHHTVQRLHRRTFIYLVPWRNLWPAIALREMHNCNQLSADGYNSNRTDFYELGILKLGPWWEKLCLKCWRLSTKEFCCSINFFKCYALHSDP